MLALTRFLLSVTAFALSAVAPTTAFATLVPVAPDPTHSRAVSTTRIDKVIASSGWTITLTTVEVHDNGQFKFNVAYHQNPGATNYIYCPTALFRDELFITLNDGTRIDPIDWSCKYQRGQTEYDNDMTLWARFPGVAKGYMPLTLRWYKWGLLSGTPYALPLPMP